MLEKLQSFHKNIKQLKYFQHWLEEMYIKSAY